MDNNINNNVQDNNVNPVPSNEQLNNPMLNNQVVNSNITTFSSEVNPAQTVVPQDNVIVQTTNQVVNPAPQVVQANSQAVNSAPQVNTNEQPINNNNPVSNEVYAKRRQGLFRIIAGIVLVVIIGVVAFIYYQNNESIDMKKPKSVAKAYVQAAIDKNFNEVLDYIYKPEVNYITVDDLSNYASNSTFYDEVSNGKIKSVTEVYKGDNDATYEVVVKTNDKANTYKIDMNVDYKKDWTVVVSDLYVSDYRIEVPTESDLYINNKKVDNSLVKEVKNNHDIYVIPAIAGSKSTIKVETLFGDLEEEVDISASNSGKSYIPKITDDKVLEEALENVKKIWNGIYDNYISEAGLSNVKMNYFDEKFSLDDVKKYYETGLNTLTNKNSKNYNNVKLNMDTIIKNEDKESLIVTSNVIELYFGYKISYFVDYLSADATDLREYMTRYSSIKLKKTSNGYVIYEVTDEKLFNYLKYITKEFKIK